MPDTLRALLGTSSAYYSNGQTAAVYCPFHQDTMHFEPCMYKTSCIIQRVDYASADSELFQQDARASGAQTWI